jgi:predicted nucleic acid-binding protein
MATRVAETLLLDTSVLISATTPARALHRKALVTLNDWPAGGVRLVTSGQIIREYLCVATRPAGVNGLALSRADALANVRAFLSRMRVLDENRRVLDALLALIARTACTGKNVHDANVVATCLAHRVEMVVTENTDDFARFPGIIHAVSLDAAV